MRLPRLISLVASIREAQARLPVLQYALLEETKRRSMTTRSRSCWAATADERHC